jgi:hypothetical protein
VKVEVEVVAERTTAVQEERTDGLRALKQKVREERGDLPCGSCGIIS